MPSFVYISLGSRNDCNLYTVILCQICMLVSPGEQKLKHHEQKYFIKLEDSSIQQTSLFSLYHMVSALPQVYSM